LALILTYSCSNKTTEEESGKSTRNLEVTAKDILGNSKYQAISYEGYREKSRKIQPSVEQLKEDVKILSAMGIKILRTYNVQFPHASNLLKAIQELKNDHPDFEMYLMLGVWIDCKNAWTDMEPDHNVESEQNEGEIERAVALANQYPDIVKILAVGNEAIMGFISDNTKSKWSRRRQYVFIGAILIGVSFIVIWQLYRENGVEYNFLYFLFWSFIFYLGLTIFSVPYVAMGYEMSNDFHERTDIMAVAQWIGQWAWVIAPWFWVIMHDPSWFDSADVATRQLAVGVGIVCMIFAMVPAIFINSKSTLNENYSPLTVKNIGSSLREILQGFKEAFTSVPFRKLYIATFLILNAFNTIAAFSFFIIVYYLFNGDAGAAGVWPTLFGSLGALITTVIVIPIVAKISKKIGKKRAFLLSQGLSVFGYVLLWFLFIPGKPYMFIFALPFFSFGIGSLFTLMMSMTADVIDLDELNSGKRRESVFGAIYWWMVKFGFAIAGLHSGTILTIVGFDATLESQTEGAVIGLKAFYSGLPILGTLVAMYVMRDYYLTEERSNEIRAELDARKKTKPLTITSIYQNKEALILTQKEVLETDFDFPRDSPAEIKNVFSNTLNTDLHGI